MKKLFINILVFFTVITVYGITLSWCPNTNSDLGGYRIYYGVGNITNWTPNVIQNTNSFCDNVVIRSGSNWLRNYTSIINVGNNTSLTLTNLEYGITYYFALTSITTNGIESEYSNEEKYTLVIPTIPSGLSVSSVHYNNGQ